MSSPFLDELQSLLSLATPISAMNLLIYLRGMISVLCLARLGPLQLAGGALSLCFTNITGYSLLFGLSSALEPLCSQAYGSHNFPLFSLSLQRSFLLLLSSSLPISFLWLNLRPILLSLNQNPHITSLASTYCLFSLPDLLTNSFLQPLRVFLRSQNITKPMPASSAAALLLHFPLTFFLAFYLKLGVRGVALAAVLTNFNMTLFLVAYLWFSGCCNLTWTGWSWKAFGGIGPLWRLALPSCFGVCLEWWWYEIVTVLAGYLPNPTAAVGATAIVIQTTSLMYTVPMALAACVSTRVGNELGAGRPRKARMAAIVAIGCAVMIGLGNVVWTMVFNERWTRLFTNDVAVGGLAAAVMPLIGLCELGNCPQTTGCGVLRGMARPAIGARINLVSFYLVGMPVAVGLAFGKRVGFGGIWYGLLTAQIVCVVSVALVVFWWIDWDAEAARAKKLTGVELGKGVGEEGKRFLDHGEE